MNKRLTGALVATAVASLFLAGHVSAAEPAKAAAAKMVKCTGVNACSGKGGCKGATNACKGKNGCKGKGWTEMSDKDCAAKSGKVAN